MASPPRPWDNVFTMEGLPARVPVLAIRNRVLFQGGFLRLTIGRPRSLKLAEMIWDGKTGVTPDARGVAIFSTRPADAPEGAGGATDTGGGGVGAEVLRPATPAEKKAAAGRRASGAAGGEGGAASPGSATGGGESGAATVAGLGGYGGGMGGSMYGGMGGGMGGYGGGYGGMGGMGMMGGMGGMMGMVPFGPYAWLGNLQMAVGAVGQISQMLGMNFQVKRYPT